MLSAFRGKCPICERATTPPLRVVLLGPIFPFGTWQCAGCFSPLRLRLLAYYVLFFLGFSAFLALLAVVGLFGEHPLLSILLVPVGLFFIDWVPARYSLVEVDASSRR